MFQIKTAKLAAVVNVGFLGSVIALTLVAIREEVKLNFVGLLCTALTIGMYASPLSVMVSLINYHFFSFFSSFPNKLLLYFGEDWDT